MTDTELKHRLSTSVEDIDAPPDLVDRARQGGSRRLRRRRLASLTATALAVVAVGGVAVAGQDLLDRGRTGDVAATPSTGQTPGVSSSDGDPYGVLMNGSTRGDLADDKAYLDKVIAAWKSSHAKSDEQGRGIFDDLRGEPKVAWAGTTPAGPAAVVVQQSFLHKHDNIQLDREGIYTLIGFFGEGPGGSPKLVADSYPAPGSALAAGFLTGTGTDQALVVLDLGKQIGWSKERIYADDGTNGREFAPLTFDDGVSIVKIPASSTPIDLRISPLPAEGRSDLSIEGVVAQGPAGGTDHLLWTGGDDPDEVWPMTGGADAWRSSAISDFTGILADASDPNAGGSGRSPWNGYGKTADGSRVLLGEYVVSPDPVRVYAALTSKAGKTTIIPGGIPDKNAALPVSIKLPDGQGWAVAQHGAQLSYRFDGGAWSSARPNASLVPAGQNAEVKVVLRGTEKIVQLK